MPMAREYQSAASLIPKELSSDVGSGGAECPSSEILGQEAA